MLQGFTYETKPLTELEHKLLPIIANGLTKKRGAVNAVSNKAICEGLSEKYKVPVSEARVRKIINYIRMHDMVPGLVANGCGYYVSTNPDEIKEYIKSLAGREQAIRGIREKTQAYLKTLLSNYQSSFFK